jgi:hypothetical protein
VSKGDFLIGDGIGDSIFGHRSSRSLVCWRLGWMVCCSRRDTKGSESGGRPLMAGVGDFGQGSGEAPDSGEAILRSRGRPKLPATAGQGAVA